MAVLAKFATFETPGFSTQHQEAHINAVCSAEEFGRWFHRELCFAIPDVNIDFYQEDFGWVIDIPIDIGSDVVMITVAFYEAEDGDPAFTCLSFDTRISALKAVFNKQLKPKGAALLDKVIIKTTEILGASKGVKNVQWWKDGVKAGDPMPMPWLTVEA